MARKSRYRKQAPPGRQKKVVGKPNTEPPVLWPTMVAPNVAQSLALAYQFALTERWSPEFLLKYQLLQIEQLIKHAHRTSPFYKDRLAELAALKNGTMTIEKFREIPLLLRTDIQDQSDKLRSRNVPKSHGQVFPVRSTGSTGRPIEVMCTEHTGKFLLAFTMLIAMISHISSGRGDPGNAFKNLSLFIGAYFIGPGKYSIDEWLKKRRKG